MEERIVNVKELCKCGCGGIVQYGNEYIHGHNRRGLVSYTSGTKWSMVYNKCVKCGAVDRPHAGKGMCTYCYKKFFYKKDKVKWSKKYDSCIMCRRVDRPHKAKGLCNACYVNELNRKKGKQKRNLHGWSWYYDECQECGTTQKPHAGKGLCVDCYALTKRNSENIVTCPVCGIKVNKLNQHLVMKAKKCNKHFKYQHDRLKMYFESDLSLSSISEELEMDKHAITRQFITYFGKTATYHRNEVVRRCNISEKAVINKNYKNMYGTLVKYTSPNQGIIVMRSKIESEFAATLEGKNWWYERDSFPYIDNNGKRRTYTPDFYIEEDDLYVEVKGNNLVDDVVMYKINWINKNTDKRIELKVL